MSALFPGSPPPIDYGTGGVASVLTRFIYYPASVLFGALGLYSPVSRAIFGGVVGLIFAEVFEPSVAYDADGIPYRWKLMAPSSEDSREATEFPWFFYPAIGAILLGMVF